MKVCDESLYHEIAVIYRFLHLYERMETMEGEALDFITRDFDAWKRRREQRRQSEKKIKKEYLLSVILAFILCLVSFLMLHFCSLMLMGKETNIFGSTAVFCGMVLLTVTCFLLWFWKKKRKKDSTILAQEMRQMASYWIMIAACSLQTKGVHQIPHKKNHMVYKRPDPAEYFPIKFPTLHETSHPFPQSTAKSFDKHLLSAKNRQLS